MTPTLRAFRYVADVRAGRVDVCKWIRLACERHERDIARQADPAYPYKYVTSAADRAVRLVELMPHTKGRWAAKGEALALEDWQCFLVKHRAPRESLFPHRPRRPRPADRRRRTRRKLPLQDLNHRAPLSQPLAASE